MLSEPTGNAPLAVFLKKLVRHVNSLEITSIYGGRFKRGAGGTQIIIDVPGAQSRGGWQYRGIWDSITGYAVNDVVKMVGAGMGTYLCQVAHTPTQDPGTSIWSGDHPPYLGDIDSGSGKQYWTLLIASGEGAWA